jgi:hypothetical protein
MATGHRRARAVPDAPAPASPRHPRGARRGLPTNAALPREVTLLLRQDCQVSPRHIAVNPHVQTGESLGPAQGQDSPPACPGRRRSIPHPVEYPLTEQQLGIVRIYRQPRSTRRHGRLRLPEQLVSPHNQGVQLAGDRISRRRTPQAATETLQRRAELAEIQHGTGPAFFPPSMPVSVSGPLGIILYRPPS